jgi:CubicO group peptidase (beta-lactamase class C family)
LLYENGEITVDKINPRFAHIVNDQTKFYSMSIGKSMTAYVLGHAICANMIQGLDQNVSDWPVLQGTLYQNAKLIDLVNMRAGDQQMVNERQGFITSGRNPNNASLKSLVNRELKDSSPDSSYFNYNSVSPNIVLNYVIYRSNGKFDELMKKMFQEKIGTEQSVFFLKQARGQEEDGLARATFYASRYDYMRIARAMLTDWKADTCEGRFLKEIYNRRQPKEGNQMQYNNPNGSFWAYRGYAGFFHTDYYNFKKDRNIISMDGYGGQMIVIDFDQGRIVATHAVHNDFDWKSLVSDAIKVD